MLKCLTLEGILDYLDHFNHSLFLSALQGCQKIGDFHQGTGVLLRLADLSTMWSAGICQIDRSLANWISQQYLLMRLTDFFAIGFMCTSESWEKGKGNCCESWIVAGHFCPFSTLFCRDLFFPQKLPPPRLLVAQGCAANQQTIKYRRRKCGAGSFEVGPIWRFCNLFL